MALVKVTYAPLTQVSSANLNEIQDEIIANGLQIDQTNEFAPTIAGVDVADYSAQRGWYRRQGTSPVVDYKFNLAWNNVANPGNAALSVDIEVPFQLADQTATLGPLIATGIASQSFCLWPTKATDRAIIPRGNHLGPATFIQMDRISSTNTSLGTLAIGTGVVIQIEGSIQYLTDGVFLL